MTIPLIAPAGAYSIRQEATVKQLDARRSSTFSGLEKSRRYNVAHKLGLRVRPTSNNNHIHGASSTYGRSKQCDQLIQTLRKIM